MTAPVLRIVPDLGEDLLDELAQVEDLLLALAPRPGEDTTGLPAGLRDRAAADAVGRLAAAIRPTQGFGPPRWLAPDGRYEHTPLRFVHVYAGDVEALAAAAAALGAALHRGDDVVVQVLEQFSAGDRTPADEVERAARVAGLLDLDSTPDGLELLTAADSAGETDLVLSGPLEAAYQRTADRLNAMWAVGDRLSRWLY